MDSDLWTYSVGDLQWINRCREIDELQDTADSSKQSHCMDMASSLKLKLNMLDSN